MTYIELANAAVTQNATAKTILKDLRVLRKLRALHMQKANNDWLSDEEAAWARVEASYDGIHNEIAHLKAMLSGKSK